MHHDQIARQLVRWNKATDRHNEYAREILVTDALRDARAENARLRETLIHCGGILNPISGFIPDQPPDSPEAEHLEYVRDQVRAALTTINPGE